MATQAITLSQTTLLSATTGKLEVYILPIWQKKLLLPTVAVVDILPASQLKTTKKNKKVGILGQIVWEQETIPVIAFETFNGESQTAEPQKIAIMVAVTLGELQYYGLALQAEPITAKVKIAEIEDLEQATIGPMEYLQIRYQNQLCVIPDLDAVEQNLAKNL
ncbi:chemotaxis protein CheW [uncultured Agitococcus sp.]|uniref:chemotaxis protein CheW n=1 Tax=uncultured Agitococcus sp. TaxID=1506599 RepID=UPI002617B1C3|nr:chemotaxis protein CheW [uncultured Agitococcus sp.]